MTRRHHIEPRNIYFDLETGGRNPFRHPITQIAAAAYDLYGRELDCFEVKVKFNEADADPESLKKHHYNPELWRKHAVEPLTAHQRFSYFLREHATLPKFSVTKKTDYHNAELSAFNANFDRDFLWRFHKRLMDELGEDLKKQNCELFLPAQWHTICVYQTTLRFFRDYPELPRPTNYQLGTLCGYFGINYSVNEAHDELYDTRRLAELDYVLSGSRRPAAKAA